ncbi:MAG: hypothetical protein SF052_18095 [Bacteroidia bacterium]|nr:hypothetical protein [Bacteroidia bacterium]
MAWQVLGEGEEIRAFAFSYDPMNRLTSAKYREKTGRGRSPIRPHCSIGYKTPDEVEELLKQNFYFRPVAA